MKTSALTTLLFIALALLACADDEHTSNTPPDLRMEDVLGCWNKSINETCEMICYDSTATSYYQFSFSDGSRSERVSHYWLAGFRIIEEFAKFERPLEKDTIINGFCRKGRYLYYVNSDLNLGYKYYPVDIDSGFPCGKPFTLLPKPANWTLF